MSTPKTARSGIQWAGAGMLIAVLATFLMPGLHNRHLMVVGIVLGALPAWIWGKRVAITDMPQMVALFNGMGGGSAAAIGAAELLNVGTTSTSWSLQSVWNGSDSLGWVSLPTTTTSGHSSTALAFAALGGLIGAVSLTGSVIAWAKLDGRMDKRYTFPKDTAASILTSGLLGETYVGLDAGGDDNKLGDGDRITITQSAVVLEKLIGQFLFSKAAEDPKK